MSTVRLLPLGPGRFRVFIDGHEITKVVSVDTSELVAPNALPRLGFVIHPEAFVIEPQGEVG